MAGWSSFSSFLAEAWNISEDKRQALVDTLLQERSEWPWINGAEATFICTGSRVESAALNLDNLKTDPPLKPMIRLGGTDLHYVNHVFAQDDLLDYLIAINDPMTPLAKETDLTARVTKHWKIDAHNPKQMQTSTMDVSVLQMPQARPFPDWALMKTGHQGNTVEHKMDSKQLGVTGRKVWVHTPPSYKDSNLTYPLLILQDGQWMASPLQVPMMADVLVKHGRMAPVVIAMIQSGNQEDRLRDYVGNDQYYTFIMTELIPFLQTHYRIDPTNLGIGGASAGAIAGMDAALKNPAIFSGLMMFSPPLGKGTAQDKLAKYIDNMKNARLLPQRIFHSVGRYEAKARFLLPNQLLSKTLSERQDTDYRFVELASGHGLVAFRSVLPEALAHIFPGYQSLWDNR